jgi:Fibronectin type III domain
VANSNRPRRANRVVVPATFALVAVAVASLAGCSSSSAKSTPPPQPPTDVTVTDATGPAGSVSFKAPAPPASNDDSTISGYTAACTSSSAGTKTQTGSASPITVTNLSVGHAYTCTVKAQGPGGTSAPSAPSASFTPVTAPGAPNAASGVPYGPTQVKLLWNAPASAGGSPITGYSVKPYLGGAVQPVIKFTSTKTVQVLGNLRTGGTYLFQIAAVNAIGTSAWSPKSGPVTVGTPGQPGSVKAVKAAPGQLRVSFAAPANNGATINTYTAGCNSSNGGTNNTKTVNAPTSSVTVVGLTSGKTYTCLVKATNSRGTGPNSNRTAAVGA